MDRDASLVASKASGEPSRESVDEDLVEDIHAALSKLRDTLERIDVFEALAKHEDSCDPSSKLHLLQLILKLLSRLQLPQQARQLVLETGVTPMVAIPSTTTTSSTMATTNSSSTGLFLPASSLSSSSSTLLNRRKRATRHTIGISAEELASARRWLEEERRAELSPFATTATTTNKWSERAVFDEEEIRDKCTKDAINQRQSLRDKSRDQQQAHVETHDPYRSRLVAPALVARLGREANEPISLESTMHHDNSNEQRKRAPQPVASPGLLGTTTTTTTTVEPSNDDPNRKLAATLRQVSNDSNAFDESDKFGRNKYAAKKSKIKRANTIDIPSYLKLQAESLGRQANGCVSLRRPINVGDKPYRFGGNVANSAFVPSFQPKTENDRKFLALIKKNNESTTTPAMNANAMTAGHPPPVFKIFGKTDPLINENWNSRFSNIKTTFDKPKIGEEDVVASSKRPPGTTFPPRTLRNRHDAVERKERTFYENLANRNASGERDSNALNYRSPGFRHDPSSPFRKIEKTSAVLPSRKIDYRAGEVDRLPPPPPPPPIGCSLREKARIMFDRDHPQRQQQLWYSKNKAEERQEKHSFSRPPWLEQDGRSVTNGPVNENGRLDYRSFYKQFAPFVGKGSAQEHDEQSQLHQRLHQEQRQEERYRCLDGKKSSDEKIPFEATAKLSNDHSHCRPDRRRSLESQRERDDEFPRKSSLDVVEDALQRDFLSDRSKTKSRFVDASIRDNASVAVQTGLAGDRYRRRSNNDIDEPDNEDDDDDDDDDDEEDVRPFRVARMIDNDPLIIYSNASVQTCDRLLDRLAMNEKQRRLENDFDDNSNSSSDYLRRLGRRQEYVDNKEAHDAETINMKLRRLPSRYSDSYTEAVPGSVEPRVDSIVEVPVSQTGTNEHQRSSWHSNDNKNDVENLDVDEFLNARNIQNQDIGPEVGVVTRYTCAIGTVASSSSDVDLPESRSGDDGVATSISPSPSDSLSSSPAWLNENKSRPVIDETTTSEDEIRRHNMLQQSLVQRLQNERCSMVDRRPFPSSQPYQQRSSDDLEVANVDISQQVGATEWQNAKTLLRDERNDVRPTILLPSLPSPPPPPPSLSSSVQRKQPTKLINRSNPFVPITIPRIIEPPCVCSSNTTSGTNRVTALRETYEQQPSSVEKTKGPKDPQKERSPIPSGNVNPIDSSDEYLIACANRPSGSIVLSKSESWHQLTLSSGRLRAPRTAGDPSRSSLLQLQQQQKASHQFLRPPKPNYQSSASSSASSSPSSMKSRTKQYEASSDSVKKMEDKIRRYFDGHTDTSSVTGDHDSKDGKKRSSSHQQKLARGMTSGISRSRTMPGICEQSLALKMPTSTQPPTSLLQINSADVDKVFDDLFEETTRSCIDYRY